MLPLRHILLLSSGYLHYISITSSFISWYNNVISGSRKTKQHISLELPQRRLMLWRKQNTDLITGTGLRAESGRLRLTSECETVRRVSAVTESCGRERLTGQRRCVTPMMLVTTSDNPRGPGPGITDSSTQPSPSATCGTHRTFLDWLHVS